MAEGGGTRAWEAVKIELPDSVGVATLLLNRPARANSLNWPMFQELPLALRALEENPSVRVIILSAAGKRHFCAGIDLDVLSSVVGSTKDSVTGKREFGKERYSFIKTLRLMQDAISAVEKCSKPVIGAIFGPCLGGGVDLITACDIR
jgi:enoyl-CoA hydratase/carnithine racemase